MQMPYAARTHDASTLRGACSASERNAQLRVTRLICGKRLLAQYWQTWSAFLEERQRTAGGDVVLTAYQTSCLDLASRARYIEEKVRERREKRLQAVRAQAERSKREAVRQENLWRHIANHGDLVEQNREATVWRPKRRARSTSIALSSSPAPSLHDVTAPSPVTAFLEAFQWLTPKQRKAVLTRLTSLDTALRTRTDADEIGRDREEV